MNKLELTKELQQCIKWIPEQERPSKWFFSYLDKINVLLKKQPFILCRFKK